MLYTFVPTPFCRLSSAIIEYLNQMAATYSKRTTAPTIADITEFVENTYTHVAQFFRIEVKVLYQSVLLVVVPAEQLQVRDVARAKGTSRDAVYRAIKSGKLTSTEKHGQMLVVVNEQYHQWQPGPKQGGRPASSRNLLF